MNKFKKLNKAISELESSYDSQDNEKSARRTLALKTKRAYKALDELLADEQHKRNTRWFARIPSRRRSIAEISHDALSSHRGWAERVIDTADTVLESSNIDYRTETRCKESLAYAKDYLLRTKEAFAEPQRDSSLQRGMHFVTKRFAKFFTPNPYKGTVKYTPARFKGIAEMEAEATANVEERLGEYIKEYERTQDKLLTTALPKCERCGDTGKMPVMGPGVATQNPCDFCGPPMTADGKTLGGEEYPKVAENESETRPYPQPLGGGFSDCGG